MGSLGLICCWVACVSDLPGLLPQPAAQLVLWSEIRAGEAFEAYLGRTFPIEGPEPDVLWLETATVEVWQGDRLLAQLEHQEKGRYLGPPQVVAREGVSYRLEARWDTLQPVKATAAPVPPAPFLRFFDWQDSAFSSNPFNSQLSAGQLSFELDTSMSKAYGYGLRTFGYLEGKPQWEDAWFLDQNLLDDGPNPCAKFSQTRLHLSLAACRIGAWG
ncbi:MAG: hypothetical protein OHK0039_18000 [Bacteroidia bacterium]